ncbi:hypothetical protein ACHAWT_002653 [Skeletonema menzelii]|mmetsp:Transcript_3088/g.5215  ORF Transcript_3088/g.5215 Transcript_3088/m.5215 type:complete len:108 (-) Transcript_3088:254-577(-)
MIRSTLLLVVAAAIGGADAFAPVGMSVRANTQLFMDKQGAKTLEDKLKADPQLKEASRATILECDETECAQAQCTQDRNGNWHCEGGLEGDRENSKTQVLMHSDEDD